MGGIAKLGAMGAKNTSRLFDMSDARNVPDVPQFPLERHEPPRGMPKGLASIITPENARRLGEIAKRGMDLGGPEWYYTVPLKERFILELGPEEGPVAFRRFIDYVSATSPRAKVAGNIRRGSYFYGQERQGLPVTVPKEELPPGYGHLAHTSAHMALLRDLEGGGTFAALSRPKTTSFSENLAGNQRPMTIDTHNMKAVAGRDRSPTAGEYRYLEDFQSEIAYKLGLTPAQFQASIWVAGDTGVANIKPFLEVFDDVVESTAIRDKKDKEQVLKDFITGEAPLYGLATLMSGLVVQDGVPKAEGMALGGAVSSAAKAIRRLVDAGFPESTAEKIVMGELPMDPAIKTARMAEQGYTTPAYSGSTFDIRAFDTSGSNPASDFGIGTYATTSPLDATANYAGLGPDRTQRIELEALSIFNSLADDKDALEEALSDVGLTLQNYYDDPDEAFTAIAMSKLVGDAPGGVTYPLQINTQNYAVIGGDNPTMLRQQRDYDQEAFAELGPGADSHDAFDRALELMYEDPQGLYARVRQALLETDAGDNVDVINSVMEDLEGDIVDGMVRIQDIDAAIRRNALSGQDFMTGDDVPFGDISRQTIQNLGFEGVIDNTVDLKFGTNRQVLGTRVPGMTGVTPDTSHIITFPGFERNIRSQFAAFDPDQTGSSNILAGLGPAAIGAGLFGASMAPEEAEAAGFGTLARAIGRPTRAAYTGSAAKYARPSLQSVGTGEGNQAFGYGLYFSDSPEIAGGYRRGVAGQKVLDRMSDRYFMDDLDLQSVDEMLDLGEFSAEDEKLMRALQDADYLGFDRPMDAVRAAFGPDLNAFDASDPAVQKLKGIADEVGFLYEVEVPADDFIDWNLTLEEQPEVVQQVVRQNAQDPRIRDKIDAGSFRGSDAYYLFGNNPEVNSMMWAQYGVPGVRYNSFGRTIRGLDDARARKDAPQNYVIFDENLINIVRRNDEALENNFDERAAQAAALDVRKPLAATLAAGAAGAAQAGQDDTFGDYDQRAVAVATEALDRLQREAKMREGEIGPQEVLEAAATIGSSILGSVPAGLAGLYTLATTGDREAAEAKINEITESLTYMPTSQGSIDALQAIAGPLEALAAPSEYVGQKTLDITGSPLLATAAEIFLDPLNLLSFGGLGAALKRAGRTQ